jgi:hypothetical protein
VPGLRRIRDMPVPDEGVHEGHLVQRGLCVDCGRGITREDILTVRCLQCGAFPGDPCVRRRRAGSSALRSHVERMLLAHGHSLVDIPELARRQREHARQKAKRGKSSR